MTLCFPVAEETVSNETVINESVFLHMVLENDRHVTIENVAKHITDHHTTIITTLFGFGLL